MSFEEEKRWSRVRAPDRQSRGWWFNPTYHRFETYAISFTPHLPVSFGRDTNSRWSLLSGVYARRCKRSNKGVNVLGSQIHVGLKTPCKGLRPVSERREETTLKCILKDYISPVMTQAGN